MNTLSEYAKTELEKFVQNKQLQEQLSDVIVFYQLTNTDDIVKLCLDMFLLQVEISKLEPFDLELLKMEIRHIRSTPIDRRDRYTLEEVYGDIKMLDKWSDSDFDKRIREGRATKRFGEYETCKL